MKTIDIYYFSGTGNTEKIVKVLKEKLLAFRFKIDLFTMEKGFLLSKNKAEKVIFVFPANSQSVSPFVWRFFKALPKGNGRKVCILTTLNDSVYITKPLIKLLKKKGYQPFLTSMVSMPNNMLMKSYDEEQDKQRVEKALVKVDEFVNRIVRDEVYFDTEHPGSRLVSFLSRSTILPWLSMRLLFKLETDKEICSRCGQCEGSCPVKNIKIKDYPVHGNKCEFCMRCAANCPKKAIHVKGKKEVIIRKYLEN